MSIIHNWLPVNLIHTFKALNCLITSIHRHNNSSLFVRHCCVFFNFAPGLKNGFYFFFLSRISTALLGHVRMSHHLIQYTNMCQNFQQFTNRFTYWMRNEVSCTITVSKTLTRAVLGQWTRGSFKCCARVCFEILLL